MSNIRDEPSIEAYMPKKTSNTFNRGKWWMIFYYLDFQSINLDTLLRNSMTQNYPFFYDEVALFLIELNISLLTSFK